MADEAALLAQLHAALARTARGRLDDAAREVAAADLHVTFTQPPAGALRTQGRVTGGGRSVCFCEVEAHDDQGRLVARAMGTFRYRGAASA